MMIGDRVFREITDNVWDPKRRIGVDAKNFDAVLPPCGEFSYWRNRLTR
jgi:hypothetical protein